MSSKVEVVDRESGDEFRETGRSCFHGAETNQRGMGSNSVGKIEKTVETVFWRIGRAITSLNRGVNENFARAFRLRNNTPNQN